MIYAKKRTLLEEKCRGAIGILGPMWDATDVVAIIPTANTASILYACFITSGRRDYLSNKRVPSHMGHSYILIVETGIYVFRPYF